MTKENLDYIAELLAKEKHGVTEDGYLVRCSKIQCEGCIFLPKEPVLDEDGDPWYPCQATKEKYMELLEG